MYFLCCKTSTYLDLSRVWSLFEVPSSQRRGMEDATDDEVMDWEDAPELLG